MKYSLVICWIVLYVTCFAQTEVRHYETGDVKADYAVKDGMLNGRYVSYYKNGKTKAEGVFQNNCRKGKWIAYDSTGKSSIVRMYTSPLDYRLFMPHGTIDISSFPRNADGYYPYFPLHERAIIWSQRIWAYIFNSDNPVMGDKGRLFKMMYSLAVGRQVGAYKGQKDMDQKFSDSIDFSSTPLDTTHLQVLGFMIKQDWFYDKDRDLMDSRIIGICPVAAKKNLNSEINKKYFLLNIPNAVCDTVELFWVYFPQLRKYLAKEEVTQTNVYPNIRNLDDIFFCRSYNETIFYTNSSYTTSSATNSWNSIMKMIDLEHEIWLGKQQ